MPNLCSVSRWRENVQKSWTATLPDAGTAERREHAAAMHPPSVPPSCRGSASAPRQQAGTTYTSTHTLSHTPVVLCTDFILILIHFPALLPSHPLTHTITGLVPVSRVTCSWLWHRAALISVNSPKLGENVAKVRFHAKNPQHVNKNVKSKIKAMWAGTKPTPLGCFCDTCLILELTRSQHRAHVRLEHQHPPVQPGLIYREFRWDQESESAWEWKEKFLHDHQTASRSCILINGLVVPDEMQ